MTVQTVAPVTYENVGRVTGFLIVPAGQGQVNVYNGDITNTLLVSPNQTPNLTNSVPVQPLTNAKIDGSRRQYASALSGTIAQVTVSDTELSPSPAQIATQISTLGLMKDATGQSINTNTDNTHIDLSLGTNPILNGTVASALTSVAGRSVAQDLNQVGINTALPFQVGVQQGPFAVNAAWGPITFTFPVATAYEMFLLPNTPGQAFVTDVTIQHLDVNGNIVYTELFCVTNLSNQGLVGGTTAQSGVIIRGNLHGVELSITGLSISQANFNTVNFGGGGFTIGAFNVRMFAQPIPVASTSPKIIPIASNGTLALGENAAIAAGGDLLYGLLPSFSGTIWVNERSQTGGGFNTITRIESFSVIGGTTAVAALWFQQLGGANVTFTQEIALDQFLHRMHITNLSATVAGNIDFLFTTEDFL